MAIIFFEGFNTPHIDTAHWSTEPDDTAFVFGQDLRRVAGNGAIAHQGVSEPTITQKELLLQNIGTHSAKKLYVGFGILNFMNVVDESYTGPTPKLIEFYDSSGAAQFCINADNGITLTQASATVGSWPMTLPAACTNVIPNITAVASWLFLEFEIDMSVTPNKITLHIDGLTKNTNTAGAYLELPVDVTNIHSLKLYGSIPLTFTVPWWEANCYGFQGDQGFDDFYIIDDTGNAPTAWAGIDAVVYPVNLNEGAPVVNQWGKYGNPGWDPSVLNSEDGDSSYMRAAGFNKTQLYPLNTFAQPALGIEIGAIKINATARNVSLPAAYDIIYRDTSNVSHTLQTVQLTNTTYTYTKVVSTINPQTTEAWTFDDINNGHWGVKSVQPS